MSEGLLSQLTYRVLDPNTGAELINPLPHPHQSSWTVMALQPGAPAAGTIGTFKLPLFAPHTEQYRAAKSIYDLLAPGQRVEAYIGNQASGTPKFSGVLNEQKFQKTLTAYEIGGHDSLVWLHRSLLLPGEQIGQPVTGLALVQRFSNTQEVVWDDDFAGGATDLTNNYNSSGWSASSSDPFEGLPALTSTTLSPTIAVAVTKTTWTSGAQYAPSVVSIHGTMVAGLDTVDATEASILLLSDSTAQNGVMVRAVMVQTGAGTGLYNVSAQIYTIAAGVYTQQAQVTNVLGTLTSNTLPFEVQAVIYSYAGKTSIRCLVNGKDPGCVYQASSLPASGGIGLRFSAGTAGGSPAVYVNRIQFHSRTGNWGTNRFGAGTQSSNQSVHQDLSSSSQSHLDMMALACGLDGFYLRKNPGRGFKADTLDYGASPGADLSATVRFEEGMNLEDVLLGAIPEAYATDVRMNAIPGGDSGGAVTWGRIGAIGDMVQTDTVVDVGIPGYALLVGYAQRLQGRKVNPWVAKVIDVERDPLTADKARELDTVTLHAPSVAIANQEVLILGYVWTENSLKQRFFLDQYSQLVSRVPLQRLARAVETLTTTYATR